MSKIAHTIEGFLNANYPCNCDASDPHCAKESHEAFEVARLIKEVIDDTIDGVPDFEIRARLDALFPERVS